VLAAVYSVRNEMMFINENLKRCGRKQPWPASYNFCSIFLEGLRKLWKTSVMRVNLFNIIHGFTETPKETLSVNVFFTY
jgi:hypothetical protein